MKKKAVSDLSEFYSAPAAAPGAPDLAEFYEPPPAPAKPAPPASPAAPAAEPGLLDKAAGLFRGTGEAMAGQARALASAIPFSSEIKGANQALAQGVDNLASGKPVGLGLGDAYRGRRDAEQAVDDKALADHPVIGAVGNTAVAAALPALSTTIKGVGLGAKIARVAAPVVEAAIQGVDQSKGDLTRGEVARVGRDAGLAAAVPAAIGLAGGGAKVVKKIADKAIGANKNGGPGFWESALSGVMTRSIKKGASAKEAKIAFGSPQQVTNVVDLTQRTPALKKAVRSGDHEAMVEAADSVLDAARPKTAPVYAEVDKALGPVDPDLIRRRIDDEIVALQTPGRISGSQARIASLEQVKADLDAISGGGKKTISTQDLREFATGLLKQRNATVGAFAETPGFAFRRDNHRLIDEALNDRLDVASKMSPELGDSVASLRDVNRDVSAALAIKGVAEDSIANASHRQKGLDEKVGDLAKRITSPTAIAGALGGAGAVAAGAPIIAAGVALPKLTKEATYALGTFARKVRRGEASTKSLDLIGDLLKAGVPRNVIRGVIKANEGTGVDDEGEQPEISGP